MGKVAKMEFLLQFVSV